MPWGEGFCLFYSLPRCQNLELAWHTGKHLHIDWRMGMTAGYIYSLIWITFIQSLSTSTGFKTQAKNKICPSLTLKIHFLFLTNHIITSAAWGQSALSPRPSLDRCGLWSPPSMAVGPCLWSSRVGSRECPRSIRTVRLHWDEDSCSLVYLTGHNSNSCL